VSETQRDSDSCGGRSQWRPSSQFARAGGPPTDADLPTKSRADTDTTESIRSCIRAGLNKAALRACATTKDRPTRLGEKFSADG